MKFFLLSQKEHVQVITELVLFLKISFRGIWVAQSVKHLTGSGNDLVVCGFAPHIGLCADSSEPGAYSGFCVSLSAPPWLTLCFSLSLKNE